jgi:O-antigen/teichoic acid export membrane protein
MFRESQGNLSIELGSAYLAAGARVLSWAVVSAVVWRKLGPDAFALLVLVRGTLSLLNYTGFGLAPAMVRLKAKWDQETPPAVTARPVIVAETPGVIDYALPTTHPQRVAANPLSVALLRNGAAVSLLTFLGAVTIGSVYALFINQIHAIPIFLKSNAMLLAEFFAVGCALRLASDSAGAILQTHGDIAADNVTQAGSEILWVAGSLVAMQLGGDFFLGIGMAFAVASFLLFAVRFSLARSHAPQTPESPSAKDVVWLLKYGLTVTAGSLADFLYGPLACILINRLLTDSDLAAYSAAIQIDGALLLLVTGLAAVVLPRAAAAVGSHDWPAVRRYYVRGTLAATGILSTAAIATWLLSPLLFRVWLKNPPPMATVILPLVLVHTVLGGQSQIGRAIMLAMGKARAFTVSLLAAGIANALLCAGLLACASMGVKAVPLATIAVVAVRGAIWTPWYVLRAIRREYGRSQSPGEFTDDFMVGRDQPAKAEEREPL